MSLDLSSDELYRVFVTLFELVKTKKRHSSIMMGKMGRESFCNKWQWFVVTFEHDTCLHIMSVNWVFNWSPWWSTFMSHVTPLSLSKECIVHCRIVCLSHSSHASKSFCCAAQCSKGIWRSFTSAVHTVFVSVILSDSYGYYIHIILELCSEFRVIDVGFIMALLRRDYSCQHRLIIQELVLETSLVPWDMYASMTDSLTFDMGSHHWPLINIID